MEVEEVPIVNLDEVINEMPFEKTQTTLPPIGDMADMADMATEMMPQYGDGVAVPIQEYLLYTPLASSSKPKYDNVSIDMKKKKIQEFFTVIRPHLPRKSKSKAVKLLHNIAKGTVVKSLFQERIGKKKPKKRPERKQRTRWLKTKSQRIVPRDDRSLYCSSDSCRSSTSCPHCGHSCSRIPRCKILQ